jgi:hypothetical protein
MGYGVRTGHFCPESEQFIACDCCQKPEEPRYDYLQMLKIERARWHGKCDRHPMFDPESDGIGAIKGACPRCLELQEIFASNRRTLQLMRAFAPISTQPTKPSDPNPERQEDLFASLPFPESR